MGDDASSLFTNNDPSLAYLSYIWGSGLFPGGAAATTALSSAVSAFTTVVLAVAALFFTYQLIAGIVQSAHHGQILGKEWSSLWVPIRFTIAGALMLPIGSGGAIGLQMAIAWTAKIALNAAGLIAVTAMGALMSGQPLAAPPMPSVDKMAQQAWDLEVCAEKLNNMGKSYLDPSDNGATVGSISINNSSVGGAFGLTGPVTVVPTNGGQAQTYDAGFCPVITVPTPAPATVMGATISYTQFAQARVTAIQGLLDSFYPIVHELALASRPCPSDSNGQCQVTLSNNVLSIANAISTTQGTFNNSMSGALSSATSSFSTMSASQLSSATMGGTSTNATGANMVYSSPAACGFACLGAFYNQIAAINGSVVDAINADSTITKGAQGGAQNAVGSEEVIDGGAYTQADQVAGEQAAFTAAAAEEFGYRNDLSMANWSPPTPIIGNYNSASGSAPEGGEGHGWVVRQAARVGATVNGVVHFAEERIRAAAGPLALLAGDLGMNSANPISAVSSWGAAMSAAGANLEVAIWAVGSVDQGAVGTGAAQLLVACVHFITFAGVFLSQVLPMMPYAIWLMAVIAYFILVTEALVAAPLWGFAHLKSGGEGVHGEAGSGYMIMLNVLFRPSLMVLGFIAGMAILSMGVEMLNATFALASVKATTSNPTAALITGMGGLASMFLAIAAKIGLYCSILTVIVERSFSMIHNLPDAALRWVGDRAAGGAAGDGGGIRNLIGKG